MKKQITPAKKNNKKIIVLTTIAVGATGILGYFGWKYYKKKKDSKSNDLDEVLKTRGTIPTMPTTPVYNNYPDTPRASTPKIKTAPVYTPASEAVTRNDDFPLKRGSRGEKVKALQESLIEKYGKKILPRYGADGQFGAEMATALKKSGLPASVDESTYNVLVKAGSSGSTTKENLGLLIYNAAIAKDFNKVLGLLKKLKNKDDYSTTSESFKTYRINGVRQTLVNGLLNSFTSEDQKQKIRFEFIRMGLQYDGTKWSLSGLDGLPLITTMPTTVWVNAYTGVKVPARMVLGNEVSKRLDYTLFENQGKYFLVQTRATTHLQN